MTSWKFNPELTFEQAGSEWVVLDTNAGVVLRASGSAAQVLTATTTGATTLPPHLDDTVAALAVRGVLVDSSDAPGISRRRLISTGAIAAGAAAVAVTAGIDTLILPTAAAAASGTAAPTGVTATSGPGNDRVTINWTNVIGADSYQVFYRLTSDTSGTYGAFGSVASSPAEVTSLTWPNDYSFYVVATAGGIPSLPSAIVTAPPEAMPGINWTIRSSAADNNWKSVTYGAPGGVGLYVAVAESGVGNQVMTSPDGITWTSRASASDRFWQSVTYGEPSGAGLFVAVSSGSETGEGGTSAVMTSPDGINWTSRVTPPDVTWESVTYGRPRIGPGQLGPGIFVAVGSSVRVGEGGVMTSPNGITWTSVTPPIQNNWEGVTYGFQDGIPFEPLFVAVAWIAFQPQVMTSPDGTTWTAASASSGKQWRGITYGNGQFIAVADALPFQSTGPGAVMTSGNGSTWTERSPVTNNLWRSITFLNGLFVAVASSGVGDRVMTSPDGITWTVRASAADNSWQSVTYGNGRFVAVAATGSGNRVMTSP
jgi:hypothetical protein